jgi:hypothetical protein
MRKLVSMAAVAVLVSLAGCGGPVNLTCDELLAYEAAREGRRIDAPEGLDELDSLKEMPLPRASPRPERPEGSPCLDLPPSVRMGE